MPTISKEMCEILNTLATCAHDPKRIELFKAILDTVIVHTKKKAKMQGKVKVEEKEKVKVNVYLNVPFALKNKAKGLGARWDPLKKRWYVLSDNINKAYLTRTFA